MSKQLKKIKKLLKKNLIQGELKDKAIDAFITLKDDELKKIRKRLEEVDIHQFERRLTIELSVIEKERMLSVYNPFLDKFANVIKEFIEEALDKSDIEKIDDYEPYRISVLFNSILSKLEINDYDFISKLYLLFADSLDKIGSTDNMLYIDTKLGTGMIDIPSQISSGVSRIVMDNETYTYNEDNDFLTFLYYRYYEEDKERMLPIVEFISSKGKYFLSAIIDSTNENQEFIDDGVKAGFVYPLIHDKDNSEGEFTRVIVIIRLSDLAARVKELLTEDSKKKLYDFYNYYITSNSCVNKTDNEEDTER